MLRLGVGVATAVLAISMIGSAIAQPDKQENKKKEAPAARPAPPPRQAAPPPAARSAPPPAMARPAPAARPAPPAMARPAPAIHQAPPPQRPAAAPRSAPQMAAPPRREAPRISAPSARPAPAIQRAAPVARDAIRTERREQRVQQQQERLLQRRPNAQQARPDAATQTGSTDRLQQRQQEAQPRMQQLRQQATGGRINRTERRELRQLQRDERVLRRETPTQQDIRTSQPRLERLQQRAGEGRLNRAERRELRQLQRDERALRRATATQQDTQNSQPRMERLQQRATEGRLNRAERRELRQLERTQRLQPNQQAVSPALQQRGVLRAQRVTAQQVTQGRFASSFRANATDPARRADRRGARLAARAAWQLGLLASHVPWQGPVYWPYAYNDVFYYTFWPDAYDAGYWAYAYDDMFDGIFFPDGAPYVDYAFGGYEGPYATATTGSVSGRSTRSAPGRVSQATREFCTDQAKGVTAWPFSQIEEAVQPTSEQRGLIENLKKAAADAAAQFKEACPETVPMTPPGRLQAMTMRLQATLDTVKIVRPALETFYNSLSDEQKARFNEIGPDLAKQAKQSTAGNATQNAQASCSGEKAGLSGLAVERIEQSVQPTDAQTAALDRLDDAMQKAVDTLQSACPTTIPLTPVGRLEVMQQRLEAMISAANTVRPALEDFYASLNNEQKAQFNRLGRQSAQLGG
jgi:LTXXQ motif family protein